MYYPPQKRRKTKTYTFWFGFSSCWGSEEMSFLPWLWRTHTSSASLVSQSGPWTSSNGITGEMVRNAELQTPLQTSWLRIYILIRFRNVIYVHIMIWESQQNTPEKCQDGSPEVYCLYRKVIEGGERCSARLIYSKIMTCRKSVLGPVPALIFSVLSPFPLCVL